MEETQMNNPSKKIGIILLLIVLILSLIVVNLTVQDMNKKNDKVMVMPKYQNQSDSISFEEAKKLDLVYKNED